MSGVNKVILIGNLGKDPEVRNFEGGNIVANFSLATSEVYKDKAGNKTEHTEWHNIAIWGKLAEIAGKLLRKGSKVYVEGRIKNRSWEDREGNKKYITEIVAENFTLLDRKQMPTGSSDAEMSHSNDNVLNDETVMQSDDLPF